MTEYNIKKDREDFNSKGLGQDWSKNDDYSYEPKGPPKPRIRERTKVWKEKQAAGTPQPETSNSDPCVRKATKEVAKDEPMWHSGPYVGTHPIQRNYSQNADFSIFPVLIERTFQDLEMLNPRLRREMPFGAFQHVCTSVLNAVVIDHVRTYNAEDRYSNEETPMALLPDDLCIPALIAEYCKLITDAMTSQGHTIRLNIPNAGVPIPRTEADDNAPAMPSGTFGVVDANSHNSYECYVSPYITSQLVIATRDQN